MISMCDTCIHSGSCYGQNDDYADEGGLCDHFRHRSGPKDDKAVKWLQECADMRKGGAENE